MRKNDGSVGIVLSSIRDPHPSIFLQVGPLDINIKLPSSQGPPRSITGLVRNIICHEAQFYHWLQSRNSVSPRTAVKLPHTFLIASWPIWGRGDYCMSLSGCHLQTTSGTQPDEAAFHSGIFTSYAPPIDEPTTKKRKNKICKETSGPRQHDRRLRAVW